MRTRLTHGIGDLARDMAAAPPRAIGKAVGVVRDNAQAGNRWAKRDARRTARTHGRHYADAFLVEAVSPLAWVYGPHPSLAQGEMAFEGGEGLQTRPHRNLERSLDHIRPRFHRDAAKILDDLGIGR